MAERKLTVVLAGDASGLQRAVGKADSSMKGLGSKFAAFGKKAALGIGAAAVGVGVLGKSAVDAGSDLNETLNKSNTVFGNQAKAIEDWADTAATGFGQSKQQALEAASSFGNMFSQLGIGETQAAAMSKSMTELASDFASFHNADITEVLTAQQAAFRGEYDALQRFVPTITAATVEQKALAMTGKATTKELTAQEKALAVQALMMENAGDAAGDFDRTSDGLANRQRILTAQFEDVKAKIGQALIPVVMQLADVFLNRVVPAFQSVSDWVRVNWPQIKDTIIGAVQSVRDFVAPIVSGLQTLWNNFGNNILTLMQRVWPAIKMVIEGALNIIRGVIQIVTSLIKGDWSGVWNGIKTVVAGVWQNIQGLVRTALEGIRAIIGLGMEIIGSVFKAAWNGIVSWFRGIASKLGSAASAAWNALKSGLAAVVNWIIGQIDRALGPIDEILGKLGRVFSTGGGGPRPVNPLAGGMGRGHAMGGPVSAGGLYPVGERGPELLQMGKTNGRIIPNHAMGGSSINVYVAGSVLSDRDLVATINRATRKGIA